MRGRRALPSPWPRPCGPERRIFALALSRVVIIRSHPKGRFVFMQQAVATTPTLALDDPSLYFNRELSWLEFNRRVLEEARDPSVPPLERLKFLAIFESNLDEFFMVRVGGLQEKVQLGIAVGSGADHMPVKDL